LEAVGQQLHPDDDVLLCRVVDPDDWCHACLRVASESVLRPLALVRSAGGQRFCMSASAATATGLRAAGCGLRAAGCGLRAGLILKHDVGRLAEDETVDASRDVGVEIFVIDLMSIARVLRLSS
jgi:hypothetical protein